MSRFALLSALFALTAVAACKKDSGDTDELEQRVKKLETEVERLKEIEGFIRPIMEQQQNKASQQAAREPDPDAVFAMPVGGNQFDGPADAAVTIVEAFDFA